MSTDDGRGEQPIDEEEVQRMLAELDALGAAEPSTEEETGDATEDAAGSTAAASETGEAPEDRIALVLTPVASAPALAGLCAMSGIDVGVVPTSSGAVAVLRVPARQSAQEWDIGELVPDEGAAMPPEAEHLARTLSRLSRAGVVLLSAQLATDVGIESGLSGQVAARRYAGGEDAGEVAAGLIIATADQVVEDLILGRSRPEDVRGYQRSGDLPRWKAARLFGKGLRRRKP